MWKAFHALAPALAAMGFMCATASAGAPQRCPGRSIAPARVITGQFGGEHVRSIVMLPFRVPPGTKAVRVKYCHDQPDVPVSTPLASARHTLDLGLYEPRRDRSRAWGMPEFRGWGGSSHPDVTVSAEGFSTEAQYTATPRVEPAGKTTRAFRRVWVRLNGLGRRVARRHRRGRVIRLVFTADDGDGATASASGARACCAGAEPERGSVSRCAA